MHPKFRHSNTLTNMFVLLQDDQISFNQSFDIIFTEINSQVENFQRNLFCINTHAFPQSKKL